MFFAQKDRRTTLKALYDDFPAHRLWVSDSSAPVLRTGLADDSNRFMPIRLPLLSFREFLFLETGTDYEICNPFEDDRQLPFIPGPAILAAFQKYRTWGSAATLTILKANDMMTARILLAIRETFHDGHPWHTDG